jgi:hypothetical protein
MEQNCVNCNNAIEENLVYRCTLAKVQEYEKGDSLSTGQYKVVNPKINSNCIDFEPKIKA